MKTQTTIDMPLVVDAYLQWMASQHYSPHTIMLYRLILKHWVAFGKARSGTLFNNLIDIMAD